MERLKQRIRILYTLPYGGTGGAEHCVLALCRYLDRKRFEPHVLFFLQGGRTAGELQKMGVPVSLLGMRSGFDVPKALAIFRKFWRSGFDIVHTHGQCPLGKLFVRVSSNSSVHLHTDHGTVLGSRAVRPRRVVWMNRLLVPFTKRYVAISQGMVHTLRKREWVPEEKITVIYNGVEVDLSGLSSSQTERLREKWNLQRASPIIGTVGRMVQDKRIDLFLYMAARLSSRLPRAAFPVVGEGPLRGGLEELARSLGLDNRVVFAGEQERVSSWLALMDVFVFPTMGEAFSLALLEAMACGKPVAAFRVEGVKEAVLDGETGLLAPYPDREALGRAVEELIANPSAAQKMGERGKRRVQEQFSRERFIEEHEKLYHCLLGGGRSR